MAARRRGPQPLSNALADVIQSLGIGRKMDEARTIEGWAILAGPQINAVTHTAWVKGGRLYVKITSPVWRHELHLQRRQWRQRLNDHLGTDLVQEIVFR